jgi:hypothetical protein
MQTKERIYDLITEEMVNKGIGALIEFETSEDAVQGVKDIFVEMLLVAPLSLLHD